VCSHLRCGPAKLVGNDTLDDPVGEAGQGCDEGTSCGRRRAPIRSSS